MGYFLERIFLSASPIADLSVIMQYDTNENGNNVCPNCGKKMKEK